MHLLILSLYAYLTYIYQLLLHLVTRTTHFTMSFFAAAPEPPTELGRYRPLSSTAGVRCSPLQLGAMSIGDAWSGFLGSMSKVKM